MPQEADFWSKSCNNKTIFKHNYNQQVTREILNAGGAKGENTPTVQVLSRRCGMERSRGAGLMNAAMDHALNFTAEMADFASQVEERKR